MESIYNCLYKVDVATQSITLENFAENDNVIDYVMELIQNVSENEGDREYIFEDGCITMKTFLENIIINNSRDSTAEQIAKRLLPIETDIQQKIIHLGKEIQKGILIISYIKMTNSEYKLIISKADYTEFIEELSGNKKNGLPIKKKIFKSFIANVSIIDKNSSITKLVTYDSNTQKASYWWKTFLELKEIRDDEKNTLSAFNGIKTKILEPIKRKHKADYLCLWNATIAYFRGEGEFNLTHYRDNIVGNYSPFDSSLKINDLKYKINKLPEQCKFDIHFTKTPNVVEGKFKNTIKLTDEVDLIIKHDIPSIERTIKAHLDDEGRKFIAIRSDSGFEYANKIQQKNGN